MTLSQPQIGVIFARFLPLGVKKRGGLRLRRVWGSGQRLAARPVFSAGRVVGVAPRAGVAHLQELARHVHADEIALRLVGEEQAIDGVGGLARYGGSAKAPVRQDLALVRLDEENALLAPPDAIKLGMPAEVDAPVVERVIELGGR